MALNIASRVPGLPEAPEDHRVHSRSMMIWTGPLLRVLRGVQA